MKNIMNFWEQLSNRDRLALILGLSTLLIFIFYQFIYSPLTESVAMKTQQLKEKKATVAWLNTIQIGKKTKDKAQSISKTRLLSLIGSELQSPTLKNFPAQVEQTGLGDIQVSFDKVPYNPFMSWLWKLNKAYAIQLKQVNIEKTETAGVVKVMLVIAASA